MKWGHRHIRHAHYELRDRFKRLLCRMLNHRWDTHDQTHVRWCVRCGLHEVK